MDFSYEEYLEHHGIKGQKWGVKNGPPYPLGAEDHNAREKKAGWRSSLSKNSNENKKSRKQKRVENKQREYQERENRKAAKQSLKTAKQNYKSAAEIYDRAFDRSSSGTQYTRMFTKKGREKNDFYREVLVESRKDYRDRKQELKDARKDYRKAVLTGDYDTTKSIEDKRIVKGNLFDRHKNKIMNAYLEKGMSKEEALAATNRRIKIEKTLAVAAGVSVTAVVAYNVGNKIGKEYCDKVLKQGTLFQTVAVNSKREINRPYYAAFTKRDKAIYRGMASRMAAKASLFGGPGNVYSITTRATKDIKIPSRRNAAKIFADLYKTDESFRKTYDTIANRVAADNPWDPTGLTRLSRMFSKVSSTGSMSDKQLLKEGYDSLNVMLAIHEDGSDIAWKKFYDRLKAAGYNAIIDVNDTKYTAMSSRAPIIVFDMESVAKSNVQRLTDRQLRIGALQESIIQAGGSFLTSAGIIGVTVANENRGKDALKEYDKQIEERRNRRK